MTEPRELDERFADWVDGRGEVEQRRRLEWELEQDPTLAEAAERYARTVAFLRETADEERAPREFVDHVMAAIDADHGRGVGARLRSRPWAVVASLAAAAAIVTVCFLLAEWPAGGAGDPLERATAAAEPAEARTEAAESARTPADEGGRPAGGEGRRLVGLERARPEVAGEEDAGKKDAAPVREEEAAAPEEPLLRGLVRPRPAPVKVETATRAKARAVPPEGTPRRSTKTSEQKAGALDRQAGDGIGKGRPAAGSAPLARNSRTGAGGRTSGERSRRAASSGLRLVDPGALVLVVEMPASGGALEPLRDLLGPGSKPRRPAGGVLSKKNLSRREDREASDAWQVPAVAIEVVQWSRPAAEQDADRSFAKAEDHGPGWSFAPEPSDVVYRVSGPPSAVRTWLARLGAAARRAGARLRTARSTSPIMLSLRFGRSAAPTDRGPGPATPAPTGQGFAGALMTPLETLLVVLRKTPARAGSPPPAHKR